MNETIPKGVIGLKTITWDEFSKTMQDGMQYAQTHGREGERIFFKDINLQGVYFEHNTFYHFHFRNVDFSHVIFNNCIFNGGTFNNCKLTGAGFINCIIGRNQFEGGALLTFNECTVIDNRFNTGAKLVAVRNTLFAYNYGLNFKEINLNGSTIVST